MATINYKKGNLINLFYHDGTTWKTLAYGQTHSLSRSNETTEISSKDHGLHPDTEVTGSSWSMSGEYLFTPDNAKVIMGMADKGEPFSVCMAQVSQTAWADGIQPVTDISTNAAWTVGTAWVKYGNALVTSCEITANNGETATLSVEFTGSGALLDAAPSPIKSYTAIKTTVNPGSNDDGLDPEGDDVTGDGNNG